MLETISGIMFMVIGYTPIGIMAVILGLAFIGTNIKWVTGSTNMPDIDDMVSRVLDTMNEPGKIAFIITGLIGMTLLAVSTLLILTGASHAVEDGQKGLVLFYFMGSKLSVVILPLGLYLSTMVTIKALYVMKVKISRLKTLLATHMADKDAHK